MMFESKKISVHAPATVANVACGFDTLGFALSHPFDEMTLTLTDTGSVVISEITGGFDLPYEAEKNVAGVALLSLMAALDDKHIGFDITIQKNIKPGSGIGSSSASAAGAVVAANHLIGGKFSALQLIEFAMQGEKLASGTAHADNVAPAVMGGFTLVRSNCPLDVVKLPVPPNLYAVVIHPLIEVKTSDARKILKTHVNLKDAVTQWSNVGGLVAGLFMSDYGLIARSLQDVIVEPIRSILIPAFDELKQRCLSAGALGGGISGSGPSVFMLCDGLEKAQLVEKAMQAVYSQLAVSYETHVSPIGQQGVLVC